MLDGNGAAANVSQGAVVVMDSVTGAVRAMREGLIADLEALYGAAFEKLAKLGGGESSMFDSHPGSSDRAANMRTRLAAK